MEEVRAKDTKYFLQFAFILLLGINIAGGSLAYFLLRSPKQPTMKPPLNKALSLPVSFSIPNTPLSNSEQFKADVEKYLTVKAALLGAGDTFSLFFKDFTKNVDVTFQPDVSWNPASTIKAFVLIEAFRQRDIGLINFDHTEIIQAQNVVPTELQTYDFPVLSEGTRIKIRDLIDAMITQSDNIAYNTLLDVLDRRNINTTLRRYGFTHTVVGEKLNLDDNQYQNDQQVPGRETNITTARDFANLFFLLYQKKFPDADEMLAILKRQRVNYMLPALLPQTTIIAHKTGEFSPYYHDGGIVYKPADPFLLTIFTQNDDPNIVSELAKTAYYQQQDTSTSLLLDEQKIKQSIANEGKVRYLAENLVKRNVLGANTKAKQITMTAGDIGITTSDLAISKQDSVIIRSAMIAPGNFFYPLKKLWEKVLFLQAKTNEAKTNYYLEMAANRIAEIKEILKENNLTDLPPLLYETETDMKQALTIIKTTSVPDDEIIYVKQLNEILFAVLGTETRVIDQKDLSFLVNNLYDFYKVNKAGIADIVKNSDVENPFRYEPVIGQITSIRGNTIMITLANKQKKTIHGFLTTQVRKIHSTAIQDIDALFVGDRIAVVGEYADSNTIIPIFILSQLPDNFPVEMQGVLTQVNLDNSSFTITDENGKSHSVLVFDDTIIRSRNTYVTLNSIKLGSQMVVFGENPPGGQGLQADSVTLLTNGTQSNEQIKVTQ